MQRVLCLQVEITPVNRHHIELHAKSRMILCCATYIFKFRERGLPQLHVLKDKLIAKAIEPSNLAPAT